MTPQHIQWFISRLLYQTRRVHLYIKGLCICNKYYFLNQLYCRCNISWVYIVQDNYIIENKYSVVISKQKVLTKNNLCKQQCLSWYSIILGITSQGQVLVTFFPILKKKSQILIFFFFKIGNNPTAIASYFIHLNV